MALLKSILSKFKKFFVLLFGILRKGFCCRRKSRRNSGMLLPLTITVDKKDNYHNIRVNANKEVLNSSNINTNGYQEYNSQNFNNFNVNQQNSPLMSKPISNININSNNSNVKSDYYVNESMVSRNFSINTNINTNTTDEQQLEPDFFKDMTPEFRKPKKVILVNNQSIDSNKSNRFGVDMKATIVQSKELGVIDHFDDGISWEDIAANEEMWDTDQTLRDLRLKERQKRIAEHKRIKLEKESHNRTKAAKVSFSATKIG